MTGPDVVKYSDYRAFLKDYIAYKQHKQPSWSYTLWQRQLGLSSSSTLIMIVNGQRHPGKKLIDNLVRYMKFTESEEFYFRNLVNVQKKVGDQDLTVLFMNNLLKKDKSGAQGKQTDDIYFQRNVYVLREMTQLKTFKEDPEWIRSQLVQATDLKEVKARLAAMEEHGSLVRNEEGQLEPRPESVSPALINKKQVENFHTQVLEATRDAFELVPENERYFHCSFVNVSENKMEEAKSLFIEFRDKFAGLIEAGPQEGERVYQLNLHFFPATKGNSSPQS